MKNKDYSLNPDEYSMYIYKKPNSEGLMVLYTVYTQEQCIIEHVSKKHALKMYKSLFEIENPCIVLPVKDIILKLFLDAQTVETIKDILGRYYNL